MLAIGNLLPWVVQFSLVMVNLVRPVAPMRLQNPPRGTRELVAHKIMKFVIHNGLLLLASEQTARVKLNIFLSNVCVCVCVCASICVCVWMGW